MVSIRLCKSHYPLRVTGEHLQGVVGKTSVEALGGKSKLLRARNLPIEELC